MSSRQRAHRGRKDDDKASARSIARTNAFSRDVGAPRWRKTRPACTVRDERSAFCMGSWRSVCARAREWLPHLQIRSGRHDNRLRISHLNAPIDQPACTDLDTHGEHMPRWHSLTWSVRGQRAPAHTPDDSYISWNRSQRCVLCWCECWVAHIRLTDAAGGKRLVRKNWEGCGNHAISAILQF